MCAGVANCVTSSLLHPLDLAKVLMQTGGVTGVPAQAHASGVAGAASAARALPPPPPTPTLRATLRAMWARGGVRGLFLPGLSASMARELTYSAPRVGAYVPVRNYLAAQRLPGGDAAAKVLAALSTGALAAALSNPVDVAKVRLMRDPSAHASVRAALAAIARAEGRRGLYAGVGPSVLRGAAITVGQLAAYDAAKGALRGSSAGGALLHEGAPLHIAASLVAGVVAALLAAPFDVVKARAQAAHPAARETAVAAAARALRAHGVRGLFAGVAPAYLRQGPHVLICLPLLEQLRAAVGLDYI